MGFATRPWCLKWRVVPLSRVVFLLAQLEIAKDGAVVSFDPEFSLKARDNFGSTTLTPHASVSELEVCYTVVARIAPIAGSDGTNFAKHLVPEGWYLLRIIDSMSWCAFLRCQLIDGAGFNVGRYAVEGCGDFSWYGSDSVVEPTCRFTLRLFVPPSAL